MKQIPMILTVTDIQMAKMPSRMIPDEHQDSDGDGIGDNADKDDDNDGFSDNDERQLQN